MAVGRAFKLLRGYKRGAATGYYKTKDFGYRYPESLVATAYR